MRKAPFLKRILGWQQFELRVHENYFDFTNAKHRYSYAPNLRGHITVLAQKNGQNCEFWAIFAVRDSIILQKHYKFIYF